MCRLDHNSFGVVGSHCCQAVTTSCACDQSHLTRKCVRVCVVCVLNSSAVTTPKLPPPPPRCAQKRSASLFSLQRMVFPSTVTSSTAVTASQLMPYLRATTPTPPPRVKPVMPTVGHEPPGTD